MATFPHLSGWCTSAALVAEHPTRSSETAESFHDRCAGAWESKGGVTRCTCSCHTGDEAPVTRQIRVQARAQAVTAGKRSAKFLDDIYEHLRADGELTFEAPEDPKENKSLRERIYSAARRKGMRVKVTNKDGVIRAEVK